MADNLAISAERVEANATEISGTAKYFEASESLSADTRTTITANRKSQVAYEKEQSAVADFGTAIEKEAKNIRSIHVSFQEYDQMLGDLIANRNLTT